LIPVAIDSIIAKAMAKIPGDRYASMIHSLKSSNLSSATRGDLFLTIRQAMIYPIVRCNRFVIVEPSKLQGAVLKDAFTQAGVSQVQLVSTLELARNTINCLMWRSRSSRRG